MPLNQGQPTIRFNLAGPHGIQGVSYEPKVIAVEKTFGTVTENDDFWVAPAGTFITEVCAMCVDAGDANTEVSLGQDGAPHSLIAFTNFSVETVGNYTVFQSGLYLPSGDTMRITVGGTPVAGGVRFLIHYYETASIFTNGAHFSE